MILAKDILSDSILPLKPSDTGLIALHLFDEFRVLHLPVVSDLQLLGLVSENDVFAAGSFEEPVWNYQLQLQNISILSTKHIYEVLRLFSEQKLTLLPVVDEAGKYLGAITLSEVVEKLAETTGVNNPGGIVVIELNVNDYSLAEIARIAEDNDTKILNLTTSTSTDSTRMELTIKFNRIDIQPVVSGLLRYDYKIIASYFESEYFDGLKERYDMLMTYLNV